MSTLNPQNDSTFFVAGGTLPRDVRSYVPRRADEDLHSALVAGKFCYVLTSRQMGKSSLMVRAAERLRADGLHVAVLDLTVLGSNLTATQWYLGLLTQVGEGLGLDVELEDYWEANAALSPLQRWTGAFRDIVLPKTAGKVVIFVDEIDLTRSLPFSTDEFFAAIREFYNRRAQDPSFERLTFCLLGVATPSDLIRDVRTTPFNIGERIELTDFTDDEAVILLPGLQRPGSAGQAVLKRILYWTGGHPWLTQRFCQAVANDPSVHNAAGVDRVCEGLFLSASAREKSDNLTFVRDRILRSDADHAALLDIYERIRSHERVKDDPAHPLLSILRLSGITRLQEGYLYVRNRIYYRVFDKEWVLSNLPVDEVQRQRAAVRRALMKTSAIAAMVILAIGVSLLYALNKKRASDQLNAKLQSTVKSLNAANETLEKQSNTLTTMNSTLAAKNSQLKKEDESLKTANQRLRDDQAREEKMTAAAKAMAEASKVLQKKAEDSQKKAEDSAKEADRQKGIASQNVSRLVSSLDNSKQVALAISTRGDPENYMKVWQGNLTYFEQMRDLGPEQGRVENLKVLNYIMLCDSYRNLQDSKKASDACDKGITVGLENVKDLSIKDAKFYLFLLYERKGLILSNDGKYSDAMNVLMDCLHMAEQIAKEGAGTPDELKGIEDEWWAYLHLGDNEVKLKNRDAAQKDYDHRLALAKLLAEKDSKERQSLWNSYQKVGDFRRLDGTKEGNEAALKAYQDSLPAAQELAKADANGRQNLWLTQINVGEMLQALKQNDKAEAEFRESLKYTEEQIPGNLQNQLVSYERLGNVLLAENKKPEALAAYQKSFDLAIAGTKNNGRDVLNSLAICYYKLWRAHDALGNTEEARKDLQQRVDLFAQIVTKYRDATSMRDWSGGVVELVAFEEAHHNLEGARDALRKRIAFLEVSAAKAGNKNPQPLLDWYSAYGEWVAFEEKHSSPGLAREALKKRIAFLEDFTTKRGFAEPPSQLEASYRDLAAFEDRQGNAEAARQAYRSGLAFLGARAKDSENVSAKSQLAGLYGSFSWFEVLHSQFQSAIDAANAGIALDPSQVWIKVNLAHAYLFARQVDQARDLYFKNKDAVLNAGSPKTFKDDVFEDFCELQSKGFKSPDMDAISKELGFGSCPAKKSDATGSQLAPVSRPAVQLGAKE